MSAFFEPLTPEQRAEEDDRRARARVEAATALRGLLATRGIAGHVLDTLMPVLTEHLSPRLERMHGVLTESGQLAPVHGFANPFPHDPEYPGWQAAEDRAQAAREQARDYYALRLSTGWIEAP